MGDLIISAPVRIMSTAPFGGEDRGTPFVGGDANEGRDQSDPRGMSLTRHFPRGAVDGGESSREGNRSGDSNTWNSSEIRDRRRTALGFRREVLSSGATSVEMEHLARSGVAEASAGSSSVFVSELHRVESSTSKPRAARVDRSSTVRASPRGSYLGVRPLHASGKISNGFLGSRLKWVAKRSPLALHALGLLAREQSGLPLEVTSGLAPNRGFAHLLPQGPLGSSSSPASGAGPDVSPLKVPGPPFPAFQAFRAACGPFSISPAPSLSPEPTIILGPSLGLFASSRGSLLILFGRPIAPIRLDLSPGPCTALPKPPIDDPACSLEAVPEATLLLPPSPSARPEGDCSKWPSPKGTVATDPTPLPSALTSCLSWALPAAVSDATPVSAGLCQSPPVSPPRLLPGGTCHPETATSPLWLPVRRWPARG